MPRPVSRPCRAGRGRVAGNFDQRPLVAVGDVGLDGDVEFTEGAVFHADAVDRQGVQEFVGQDTVDGGWEGRWIECKNVGDDTVGVGIWTLVAGGRERIRDGVLDGVGKTVGQVARGGEDVAAEEAVAAAGFEDAERVGTVQQGPEVKQLDGEQGAEGRMDPGAGVVVGGGVGPGVVAIRAVEGGRHEVGEGDGAVAGDATAYVARSAWVGDG